MPTKRFKPEQIVNLPRRIEVEIANGKKAAQATRSRRIELDEELRQLGRLELAAHEAGPDEPAAWDALSVAYEERPQIEGEIAILEDGDARAVLEVLRSN